MRIGLRAWEILTVTALVLLVTLAAGALHFAQLTRLVVREAERQAELIARQIYAQSSRALLAARRPSAWETLRRDADLRTLLDSSLGYSPHLQYVLIADGEGKARLHGERAKEGGSAPDRPDLAGLLETDAVRRTLALYRPGQVYEVQLSLRLGAEDFGTIRLGVSTALLRHELEAAVWRGLGLLAVALPLGWVVALGLVRLALRPIRRATEAMELARRGELTAAPDLGGEEEFRELATQLELLGKNVQAERLRTLGEDGQLQQVADRLEDGLIFLHPDHRILFLNAAAERALSATLSEVRGMPLAAALPPLHPLRDLLARGFDGSDGIRNLTVALPVAGGTRDSLVSAFPVGEGQAPSGVVVLLKDLGSLQTLRSLVSYSAKLAALGRLTSGVAHEVKNPLNAMAIHLGLLKARVGGSSDEVRESVEVIETEIQRLDRAVQGFLKFVRPPEFRPVAVDITALMEAVVTLLRPEWEPRGVRFVLGPYAALPPVTGDAELLRQAFLNLVLNACQAMPAGGEVRLAIAGEPGYAVVRIEDEGVGIAPENLERIFTLYYTTKPEGSGIGLALTYRAVQFHDGTIDVQSEVGRGTIFVVRLPSV